MKRIKKNLKRYIAFLAVLIILVSITVTPAHAAYSPLKQRISAMIASALLSAQVVLSPVLAPVQQMYDYIPDQLGIPTATWDDDYLDRSVVQIWPDYTTIDGVEYTDIWFSNDAAEKFRTDAYDFITQYSLVSNSNGTFADGAGYYDGIPIYNLGGNTLQSKNYIVSSAGSYPIGNGILYTTESGNRVNNNYTDSNSIPHSFNTGLNQTYPEIVNFSLQSNRWKARSFNSNSELTSSVNLNDSLYTSSPFDFDWTSGTIPLPSPLPSDTGMMIRVPSDSPGLQTFITNNIDFTYEGGVELDFDLDPTLQVKIDDLLDIIAPIVPVLDIGDIQFTVNHDTPIPPIPDTPIIDATVPQVIQPIINEITNYGDQITQQIPNIIETIPTIDDICNNIDTAPYHDLDTGIDHLPSFFLPFITDLRSALGIWHYVTEWLGQISTTFAFITGCLVGTSIMTPIYAAIAGFMCIKIYRRMTA